MTDLISREAAIALLTKRKGDCSPESVQRAVLLAAIEDIANMPSAESEWQPIETAPRDETPILAFIPEESREYSFIYVLIYDELILAWREAAGECYSQYAPTHWMPLPEPPK